MLKQYERTGNWAGSPQPASTGRRKPGCAEQECPGIIVRCHCSRTLGSITVTALTDGEGAFFQPRAEAFPQATAAHWAEADRRDPGSVTADGRWWLPFRASRSASGDGPVTLVDAGIGPADSPAASWAPVPGRLPAELAAAGIDPADVDTVVLTHLHSDHIGWAVTGTPGSRTSRTPSYLVQRAELDAAEPLNPGLPAGLHRAPARRRPAPGGRRRDHPHPGGTPAAHPGPHARPPVGAPRPRPTNGCWSPATCWCTRCNWSTPTWRTPTRRTRTGPPLPASRPAHPLPRRPGHPPPGHPLHPPPHSPLITDGPTPSRVIKRFPSGIARGDANLLINGEGGGRGQRKGPPVGRRALRRGSGSGNYMLEMSPCLARTASAASMRLARSSASRSVSTTRLTPSAPISASTPR